MHEKIDDSKIRYQNMTRAQYTEYINTTLDTLWLTTVFKAQLDQLICFQPYPVTDFSYIKKINKRT